MRRSWRALAVMSAYKDALHISANETGGRVELAAELLSSGRGVVVLNHLLALRPVASGLVCEVMGHNGRNPHHYKAEVESAQALLANSSLASATAGKKLSWLVVEDYGMGTVELWRAS